MTDTELKRRIDAAVQHCAAAWHEDEYRAAWSELVKLIEQRTQKDMLVSTHLR